MKAWSGPGYMCAGERILIAAHGRGSAKARYKPTTPIAIQESMSIMIHKQRHKKGILESCWRGRPAKVHRTFAGRPLFVEKGQSCAISVCEPTTARLSLILLINQLKRSAQIVQLTELHQIGKKQFLIGKGFSGLPDILPDMEPAAGGEFG